jgi:hypothetical protein
MIPKKPAPDLIRVGTGRSAIFGRGAAPLFVPDIVRKCALFLGTKDSSGRFLPRATGFVASYEEDGIRYTYLITAHHIIARFRERRLDIWIRSNLKDGGVQEDHIDAPKWWCHPQHAQEPTDVAVIPIAFRETEDWTFVPLNGLQAMIGTADVF